MPLGTVGDLIRTRRREIIAAAGKDDEMELEPREVADQACYTPEYLQEMFDDIAW